MGTCKSFVLNFEMDKDEFTRALVTGSFFSAASEILWNVTNIIHLQNEDLRNQFRLRCEEVAEGNLPIFGFLTCAHPDKALSEGVSVDPTQKPVLGPTEKGIHVYKHADLCLQATKQPDKMCQKLLICQVIIGRHEEIALDSRQPLLELSPKYHSRCSMQPHSKQDTFRTAQMKSLIYMYELDKNMMPVSRPTHILPVAIATVVDNSPQLDIEPGDLPANVKQKGSLPASKSPTVTEVVRDNRPHSKPPCAIVSATEPPSVTKITSSKPRSLVINLSVKSKLMIRGKERKTRAKKRHRHSSKKSIIKEHSICKYVSNTPCQSATDACAPLTDRYQENVVNANHSTIIDVRKCIDQNSGEKGVMCNSDPDQVSILYDSTPFPSPKSQIVLSSVGFTEDLEAAGDTLDLTEKLRKLAEESTVQDSTVLSQQWTKSSCLKHPRKRHHSSASIKPCSLKEENCKSPSSCRTSSVHCVSRKGSDSNFRAVKNISNSSVQPWHAFSRINHIRDERRISTRCARPSKKHHSQEQQNYSRKSCRSTRQCSPSFLKQFHTRRRTAGHNKTNQHWESVKRREFREDIPGIAEHLDPIRHLDTGDHTPRYDYRCHTDRYSDFYKPFTGRYREVVDLSRSSKLTDSHNYRDERKEKYRISEQPSRNSRSYTGRPHSGDPHKTKNYSAIDGKYNSNNNSRPYKHHQLDPQKYSRTSVTRLCDRNNDVSKRNEGKRRKYNGDKLANRAYSSVRSRSADHRSQSTTYRDGHKTIHKRLYEHHRRSRSHAGDNNLRHLSGRGGKSRTQSINSDRLANTKGVGKLTIVVPGKAKQVKTCTSKTSRLGTTREKAKGL